MKNKLLFLGSLALVLAPLASAKSYDIFLYEPSVVGNVQLKAGDYKLRVVGDHAVLTPYRPSLYMWATPETYGKSIAVPVTRTDEGRKFDRTVVVSSDENGQQRIESIRLGGSHTELEFSE